MGKLVQISQQKGHICGQRESTAAMEQIIQEDLMNLSGVFLCIEAGNPTLLTASCLTVLPRLPALAGGKLCTGTR